MTTNATVDVDVKSLFSVKLAQIFHQRNEVEMGKLQKQLETYGTKPVKTWTKLFGDCILAITNNKTEPIKRTNEYKPKFVAELQIKYPNIDVDDFLNNLTKNEFVVLFAETLSTILQAEKQVPHVETQEEKKAREIFDINQNALLEMEKGGHQISYRPDFRLGGSHKKTPRRRKYSKRNNTRRKRTARKRRSYK